MRRLVLVPLVLAACGRQMLIDGSTGDGGAVTVTGDAGVAVQQRQLTTQVFPAAVNPKLDILFMIDNSPSMAPLQNSLIEHLPSFLTPLEALPQQLDVHVGIVSSDLGAGWFTNVPGCRVGGDQGLLQNQARHPTRCGTGTGQGQLIDPAARYLVVTPDPAGGPASTNFVGALSDAFACYAALGDMGCGFETQLGSAQAALGSGTLLINAGFLRADAYLAVILLTNEDDSSAPPDTNLWDPSETSVNSALGPLTSYRQFEFGNLCDGLPPGRDPGPRNNCVPGNWDPDATHHEVMPEEFVTFFRSLKPDDPRMVYVAVVTAPPTPVIVDQDPKTGYPVLELSCSGGSAAETWGGAPGIHLARFAGGFDSDRGSLVSMCATSLQQPLEQVASELARTVGAQCLSPPLMDADPASGALHPQCLVKDRTVDASGAAVLTEIPPCDPEVCDPASAPQGDCRCQPHAMPAGATACWYVWPDGDWCGAVPMWKAAAEINRIGSGYQLKIDRGTDASCTTPAAPAGTDVLVDCQRCAVDPSAGVFDCAPGCAPYWPSCCPTPTPGCYQPDGGSP
jgi:hypothetical protein